MTKTPKTPNSGSRYALRSGASGTGGKTVASGRPPRSNKKATASTSRSSSRSKSTARSTSNATSASKGNSAVTKSTKTYNKHRTYLEAPDDPYCQQTAMALIQLSLREELNPKKLSMARYPDLLSVSSQDDTERMYLTRNRNNEEYLVIARKCIRTAIQLGHLDRLNVPADVLEHIYERAEPVGGGTQNTAAVAHGNGGCGVGVIDGGFSLKADFSAESKVANLNGGAANGVINPSDNVDDAANINADTSYAPGGNDGRSTVQKKVQEGGTALLVSGGTDNPKNDEAPKYNGNGTSESSHPNFEGHQLKGEDVAAESITGKLTTIYSIKLEAVMDKCNGLENRVIGLEAENKGLKERTSDLEAENEHLKERVTGLDDENQGLKERTNDLEAKNEGLEGRVAVLEAENEGQEGRVAVLEAENEGLEGRFTGLEADNRGLEERTNNLEADNEGLEGRVAVLEAENEGLKGRVAVLEAENEDLKGRVNVAEEDIDGLGADIDSTTFWFGHIRKHNPNMPPYPEMNPPDPPVA